MGSEFSTYNDSCESCNQEIVQSISKTNDVQCDLSNKIEYQLKSYLSAKDPGYKSLINPNYTASGFDSKLLQKLVTKSGNAERFSYQLLYQIFAERFQMKYQNPFASIGAINSIPRKLSSSSCSYDELSGIGTKQQNKANVNQIKAKDVANLKFISLRNDFFPKSQDELIKVVDSAIRYAQRVNVYSTVKLKGCDNNNDAVNIDLCNLNRVNMEIDEHTLNDYGRSIFRKKNLFLSQCGATPKQIHSVTWPKNKRNILGSQYKVLPIVYDTKLNNLSINDIIQNGLQSSICTQFNNKSLSNNVRSFQMIMIDESISKHQKKCNSRIIQIEPSINNGAIHDAFFWNRRYPDIELIQNDEIFEAALCSMGLYGVPCSYFIELEDAYFLQKDCYVTDWDDFKYEKFLNLQKQCKSGKIVGVKLMISPYTTFDSKYHQSPPICVSTYKKLKTPNFNGLCYVDADDESNSLSVIQYHKSLLYTNCAILVWISKVFPGLIPFIMMMILHANCEDERIYCSDSEIFEDDGNETGFDNKLPYETNQFALHFDDFFDAIDDYIKLCNDLKKSSSKRTSKKQFVTTPLIIRFGTKCKGILNYNAKYECNVFIEQSMCSFANYGQTPKLYDTLTRLQSLFVRKYKASINFSKYFNESKVDLLKTVQKSKLKKYIKHYQRFNCTKMFCNPFTQKYGIDKLAGFKSKNKIKTVNKNIVVGTQPLSL